MWMRFPAGLAVSSTITTASAPFGSGAPVAISAQLPRVTVMPEG
jgi:hypothetical protein